VATILTCYYRPKPGGFCLRLFRAMRALLEAGHTVHYLAVIRFPIDHPRCHFHRFPWPREKTENLVFWMVFHLVAPLMLFYLGLRHRITHAFAFGHTYGFLMQPLRCLMSVPLTCFFRSDALVQHAIKKRSNRLAALDRFIEGLAVSGAHLVGVTDSLTRRIVARHPHVRVRSVRCLPNDLLPCSTVEHPDTFQPPIRMAMVGILETRKNQEFILHLVRTLDRDDFRLDLYGIGPDRKKLTALVDAYDLHSKVTFMGWKPADQIWPNVDLLLMPSLEEGMPNAILEALASRVPVLASNIPPHRELLPEEYLLPLKQTAHWRNKIISLLSDPAHCLKRIQEAQTKFARRLCFNWDARVCNGIISPHRKELL
jgi:glycosyltransferase involved in cell wall biosynthesis